MAVIRVVRRAFFAKQKSESEKTKNVFVESKIKFPCFLCFP